MSNRGAPWPCRNTCAMRVTGAPNAWATAKATSTRTITRSISSPRIIWGRTSVITNRPTREWRRRSKSGSKNGGRSSPRRRRAVLHPQGDPRQRRSCRQQMQPTIREAKQALRDQVGAALTRMEPGERVAASAQARALLTAQPLWRTAQWVMFFAPLPGELDVWPLLTVALSAAKKLALPRFVAKTKTYEACQILDPVS